MKSIITILLLGISGLVSGQKKLDITIIGMAHHFKEDYKQSQDFEAIQNFIIQLNPDIICIEAIPVSDMLSLREILPNTLKRADKLRDTLENIAIDSDTVLSGANYYATYDFWNAYYQWFKAKQAGDSLGYFDKYNKDQSNSEFGLMIFPAAQELEIDHLYGIDFRDGESYFMEANNKVIKKLFFGLKWKPLRIYLKAQKNYKKAEKEGRLIEFINSSEFQDSFGKLIDDLPNRLPKSKEARFVKAYWLHRNKVMAENIVEIALTNKAEQVLLTVGSAHVTHIKEFLQEKGHNVTTYGEIINSKNQ